MEPIQSGNSLLGVALWLWCAITPSNGHALLVAVATPLLFIYARHEMRNRRLLIIRDFLTSFPQTFASGEEGPTSVNPSLEFVRSKYVQDLPIALREEIGFDQLPPVQQITAILGKIRFGSWSDIRLIIASTGMMIVTYFGTDALLTGMQIAAAGIETTETSTELRTHLSLIGGLAFAGAYLAAIRGFMRGLAVFDLSAFTFIRYTVESIVSVVFVMALFRALPDPTFGVTLVENAGQQSAAAAKSTGQEVSRIWLILAPVLGYLPDSATKFALLRLQSLMSWVKMDDDRFSKSTRITPLDALDGIDYATRFRLQECGIYDVQGLATYNPIMLHIESPYGIYQAVDWIAQAQLCHLVGIEKFLVLRELQIRTIFDLERAIDFRKSGAGETDSPEEFDLLLAGVLVAPTQNLRDVCKYGGTSLLMVDQTTVKTAQTPDDFCRWFREKLGLAPTEVKTRVEHMMGWIADDLHVRRLRRIWQEISDSLGERSQRLDGKPQSAPAVG